MDELKRLTHPESLLPLTNALQKISQSIRRQKDENVKESAIKEIDFLKEKCLSENKRLSLLSCQTLYSLVEDGALLPANVLTIFISLLSNATNAEQYTALSEGIINLLLFDLKQRLIQAKTERYRCPFGLKSPQHPMITLLQRKNSNIIDLANKINGICNHRNKFIRSNSLEFLRPVFTFVLCNPIGISESKSIWNLFLTNASKSTTKSNDLFYDIMCWIRVGSPASCLQLTILLAETIEHFINQKKFVDVVDFVIYLVALLLSINENCYDSRPSLSCILRTIEECPDKSVWNRCFFNYLLITLAQLLHSIPPFYFSDALRVIKYVIENENQGNAIVRQMIMDGLIIRLAGGVKTLPNEAIADARNLINALKTKNVGQHSSAETDTHINGRIKYVHPKCAINFDLAILSEELCTERLLVTTLLEKVTPNELISAELQYILRALLLIEDDNFLSADEWRRIWKCLLKIAKRYGDASTDLMYFLLYHIAKEVDGEKQLELLRAMTTFATVKENIPLILNTYRALSTSSAALKTLSLDLYTRLWIAESRTYQFLYDILTAAPDSSLATKDEWEANIAIAKAIKEICSVKASQHGTDLVVPLSNILNRCANRKNDLAASLALDAIILLCKSNTVNIASTWNAVKNIFHSNRQHRTVRSLCEFFGAVPMLKNPTTEYEALFDESLQQLWNFVIDFDKIPIIIVPALNALRNFDFTNLMLKHMPAILTENLKIPNEYQKLITESITDPLRTGAPLTAAEVVPYIPGECWIELLEKVNQNAIDAAIGLITHLIDAEICQFRSGIYLLGDGRAEPGELVQLHARSPLRALIKYVKFQSRFIENPTLVTHCLRCIAQKYSRPLPPFNWFFLAEYINANDHVTDCSIPWEMKKYAIIIAANQIAHSGSAKSIIENYVGTFDVADCSDDEMHLILELVPSICNSLTPAILATFLCNALPFLFELSKSSKFEVNCSFERAIESVAKIFDAKCLITENVDIVVDELIKYEALLDADTRIHQKYCQFLIEMPPDILERFSTHSTWHLNNFKKSFSLRLALIAARKPYINSATPLMWLNTMIDNCSIGKDDDIDGPEKQELVLRNLAPLIRSWTEPEEMRDWLLYCMGKTQAHLTTDATKAIFSLDFLFCAITIVAGCDTFCPPLCTANRTQWLEQFPVALDLISKNTNWKDDIVRIYEFLYYLNTQQSDLPKAYTSIACQALICTKNHEYFLRKTTWMKFIDLQK